MSTWGDGEQPQDHASEGAPPTWGQPPYPPPPGYGYGPPEHPRATLALVLGLVGLVGGLMCYVPLVVSPFAWAVGRRVVREVDASGGRLGGRGQGQAGFVLGVIGTVLLVLGLVALAGLVALFATTSVTVIGTDT